MADSVRWMIEKLNHPELYKPWPLWLQREVARQVRDALPPSPTPTATRPEQER